MKSQKIREFMVQAVLIFLSVFLGIMASNWNQSLKDQKRAKLYLNSLLEEVKYNQEKIRNALPYHKRIGVVSDSIYQSLTKEALRAPLEDIGGFGAFPEWSGLRTVILDHAVYESGMATGLFENLELGLLLRITRVHSVEQLYLDISETILNNILSLKAQSSYSEFLSTIMILKTDIYGMEQNLNREYGYLITALEEKLK